MTEAIEVRLNDIILRTGLRPRDFINDDIVDEYRQNIVDLPPVLLGVDNGHYILIDGWHRYYAHGKAKQDTIMATVDAELKPEDFFITAARTNKAHGIRFTAAEKKRISKRLFNENRTATQISDAIGCSTRHASELIRELAIKKNQQAIRLAKAMSNRGVSQRNIADSLTARGFKASKSGVDRWLKIDEKPVASPQIGESPKRDTTIEESREIAMELAEPPDEPIMNLSVFDRIKCVKCPRIADCNLMEAILKLYDQFVIDNCDWYPPEEAPR